MNNRINQLVNSIIDQFRVGNNEIRNETTSALNKNQTDVYEPEITDESKAESEAAEQTQTYKREIKAVCVSCVTVHTLEAVCCECGGPLCSDSHCRRWKMHPHLNQWIILCPDCYKISD